MKRRIRLWSRLLSIPFHWPSRRAREASARNRACNAAMRSARRLRRQTVHLDVQQLEPKLALAAAAAGTKVTTVIAPPPGSYKAGDALVFKVAFNSQVAVVGTPQIDLTIGKTVRPATYFQGSGSASLGFRYLVQPGETDADGIAVAKTIGLPGGASIRNAATQAPAATAITPPSTAKVLVDSAGPVVTSVAGPAAKAYAAGAALSFTVNFNEKVFATGALTLPIGIGGTVRNAAWNGKGSGTNALVFTTVVQPGDSAPAGVRVAGPIGLSAGATLRDAARNDANLAAAGAFPKATVDAVGPAVTSFGAAVIDAKTKAVSLQVAFSEAATVKGTPVVPFTLGGVPKQLVFSSGSGKSVLTFTYKPAKGETPTAQNVAVPTQAVVLPPGGAITDKLGNVASSLTGPTGLSLSAATIAENNAVGAVVGVLTATDTDGGRDRFTYTLVGGAGAADNASFTIDGNQLKAAVSFNYEAKNSYSIRIRTTDAGGLFVEKAFTIAVTNVNEALTRGPVADGYLAGAVVYADANNDGQRQWTDANANKAWDPGEGEVWTTTDSQGNFDFDFGDPATTLRTIGGTDITTGLKFEGSLTAPGGSKVVNPLTTLVTATLAANPGITAADAAAKVRTGLGIAAGVDLTTYDPIKANDVEVQKAAASVANVIVAAAKSGVDQKAVVANIAATVAQSNAKVDLGDATVLKNVLTVGGAAPPDATVGNLAADNKAVAAATSIDDITKVQKTSQAAQASVAENSLPTTVVFQAPATGLASPTFSLEGDDKSLVSVDATGAVRLLAPANYEAKATYRFVVVAQDGAGSSITTAVTLRVTDVNEFPTAVTLVNAATSLPENTDTANRRKVADIVVSDDALGVNSITLSGADAASFEVVGSGLYLRAGVVLNFEAKPSYSVTGNVADELLAGSSPVSAGYTLAVTNVNEAPTGVSLSATSIAENNSIGAVVGTLSTTDPDAGGAFTYTLVTGSGSADNAAFTIDGDKLKAAVSFDYEVKSGYSIRIRTTDAGGLSTEKAFTITVTDVTELGSSFASATSLPLDGSGQATVSGTLPANGFAVYRVEAPRGAFLLAYASPEGSNAFVPIVRIWNAAGQEVGAPGWDATSRYVPVGDGTATYYLGVSGDPNVAYDPQAGTVPAGVAAPAGSYTVSVVAKVATNLPPTDVSLWQQRFLDGMPTGTVVSGFYATDANLDYYGHNDGDTFTYALVAGQGDADNPKFTIDQYGRLRSAQVFSVTADTDFSIRVRVTDAGGLSFEKPLTITAVKNVPPTDVSLWQSRFVDGMPAGTSVSDISVTDVNFDDGDTFAYALVAGQGDTDNTKFTIDQYGQLRSTQVFAVTADTPYAIRVKVTDGAGNSIEKQLTITIEKNVAPTDLSISGNRILEGLPTGSSVGWLGVTDANQYNGDTFAFALVPGVGDTDNARFTIDQSGAVKTAEVFSVSADTAYSVRVRVTDGAGHSFEKPLTVTIRNNVPPTDLSISGSSILEGMPVGTQIGIAGVTDPNRNEGDTFTYELVPGAGDTDNARFQFVQTSGGDSWNAGPATALVTAQPLSIAADTQLSIRVRVTDRGGNTLDKVVAITAENNLPPTDIWNQDVPVLAGVPVGTWVDGLGVTDPNQNHGDSFIFALVAGTGDTDNAKFSVAADGTLRTAQVFSVNADTTFSIRVRVTDLVGNSFDQVLAIPIVRNLAPTNVALADDRIVSAVYKTTVGTLSADDPNGDLDSHTFTLVDGAGATDNGKFEIVKTVDPFWYYSYTELRTATPLSVAADTTYSVRIRATDAGGLTFEKTFSILVTPPNLYAPVFTSGATGTVAENAAANTVIYQAAATDADTSPTNSTIVYSIKPNSLDDSSRVSIDPVTGKVRLKASADYEAKSSYSFTVVATDTGVSPLSAEKSVVVTVTDVNDNSPVFTSEAVGTVAENAPLPTAIYAATVNDADGTAVNRTVTFSIKPGVGDASLVQIDSATGVVTLKSAADYETKSFYEFTVVATNSAAPFLSAEQDVTVDVTDVNEAPTGISLSATSIAENNTVGAIVGTLSTADPDAGDSFTYTLVTGSGSADNVSFTIDDDQLKAAASFDYEAKTSYSIRIRATDADGLFTEKTFTISVTNVPEATLSAAAATYRGGDTIRFVVTYDRAVTLVGSAALKLDVGGTTRTVSLAAADRSGPMSTLTFSYVVQPGESDANGVEALGLKLTDGSTLKDAGGADMPLELPAVDTTGVLVDTVPTVVAIGLPAAGTYGIGDVVTFTVTLTEPVTVTGIPVLRFGTSGQGGSTWEAAYDAADSTNLVLTFAYTVQPGDTAPAGIAVYGVTVPDGAAIRDLDLGSDDAVLAVASSAPNVVLAGAVDGFLFRRGSDGVTITGYLGSETTLTIPDVLDGKPVTAIAALAFAHNAILQGVFIPESVTSIGPRAFAGCTGGLAVIFRGLPPQLDGDAPSLVDGTESPAPAGYYTVSPDAWTAALATATDGTFGGLTMTAKDARPTVVAVGLPADGTYAEGDELRFTVTFSEPVTVTGSPTLSFGNGSDQFEGGAVFDPQNSSDTVLAFTYAVQAGDDLPGGVTGAVLSLYSYGSSAPASIVDADTLDDDISDAADREIGPITDGSGVRIETPTTAWSVDLPNAGQDFGPSLHLFLGYTKRVTLTGSITLAIDVGGTRHESTVAAPAAQGTYGLEFQFDLGTVDPAAEFSLIGLTLGPDSSLKDRNGADAPLEVVGNHPPKALNPVKQSDGLSAVTFLLSELASDVDGNPLILVFVDYVVGGPAEVDYVTGSVTLPGIGSFSYGVKEAGRGGLGNGGIATVYVE